MPALSPSLRTLAGDIGWKRVTPMRLMAVRSGFLPGLSGTKGRGGHAGKRGWWRIQPGGLARGTRRLARLLMRLGIMCWRGSGGF